MKSILYFISLFLLFNSVVIAQNDIDQKVETILSKMTLDQKVGQMTQLNITTIVQDSILADYGNVKKFVLDTIKLVNFVKNWHIGSFLNGRAVGPENWVYVTNTVQSINAQYSDIPIMISQ